MRIVLADEREVITIPASAVSYNSYGDAVFLVRSGEPPPAPGRGAGAGERGARPGEAEGWFATLQRNVGEAVAALVGTVSGWFGNGAAAPSQASQTPEQPALWVEQRFITAGERRDGLVAILNGVAKGDRVVTAGQLKIGDGSPVVVSEESPEPPSGTAGSPQANE